MTLLHRTQRGKKFKNTLQRGPNKADHGTSTSSSQMGKSPSIRSKKTFQVHSASTSHRALLEPSPLLPPAHLSPVVPNRCPTHAHAHTPPGCHKPEASDGSPSPPHLCPHPHSHPSGFLPHLCSRTGAQGLSSTLQG